MPPKRARRTQVFRRQVNDAFLDPEGRFSVAKVIATATQIAVLYHLGKNFTVILDKSDSLLIVLTFLIAPEIVKKLLNLKYGNGGGSRG